MNYYKRKLPHWQLAGAEYFITIRLKGSLPHAAIKKLRSLKKIYEGNQEVLSKIEKVIQKKIFEKYETLLDNEKTGPTWFRNHDVAQIVKNSLHYRDGKSFDLYSYCIIPNHVHLVFKHLPGKVEKKNPITDIMRNFKRFTARKANEVLDRTGAFWQPESYDRVIRDTNELSNVIRYVLNNPVKANLVEHWREWTYSYCNPEYEDAF